VGGCQVKSNEVYTFSHLVNIMTVGYLDVKIGPWSLGWPGLGRLSEPFLTSPLAPRGEIFPLGGMFTPSFAPGVNTLLFRRMEGQTENFTPRGKLIPQGTKFTPVGQLRPWVRSLPLGAK
jgi:hypothetical protein